MTEDKTTLTIVQGFLYGLPPGEFVATVGRLRDGYRAEQVRRLDEALGDGHSSGNGAVPVREPARIYIADPVPEAKPVKRKLTMTPKMRAARKLQGQYLGGLRGLSVAQKNEVKKLAKTNGVAAAVTLIAKIKKSR